MMSPAARRLGIVVHVTTSIAWIGAVAAFLALAIVGAAGAFEMPIPALYRAMSIIGWWTIVPMAVLSALSGIVLSLGTPWGFVRHYWVLIKLAVTLPSLGLLFLHMAPTDQLAMAGPVGTDALGDLKSQLVIEAAAALVVLVVATVLSIYKPRGMTSYGARRAAGF